jgi:phosphocarrier protein HPr
MNGEGEESSADGGDPVRRTVTICNKRGLHARAAARFVKLAWQFDAEISVTKNGAAVSGRSIMGLMMLAAGPGTVIELRATGPEAERAVAALAELISGGFDEQ